MAATRSDSDSPALSLPWFERIGTSGFAAFGAAVGLTVSLLLVWSASPAASEPAAGDRIAGQAGNPVARPELATIPKPVVSIPEKPPPELAFNPNDIHAAFAWFLDARRRLAVDYKTARDATTNPLVEEPMANFADTLKKYRQSLSRLEGQSVIWPATVESIDKKGVKIRCVESDYIDLNATSTRAERYLLDVFVNGEEAHFQQYGHYNHDTEYTLVLDKQIPLAFAKTLRFGDKIMISGTVAGVFAVTYGEQKNASPPDKVEVFLTNVVASPTTH